MEGKALGIAVGLAGMAVIAGGTFLLHAGGSPPTPERPEPPPAPETLMNSVLKYSPQIYRALLEQDARKFHLPLPKSWEWEEPNGHFEELKGRRRLTPRQPIDTPHLRLALEVEKQKAALDGQAFATDHLILSIENRTPGFLAYRVDTTLADKRKCMRKGDIAYNALVIQPMQTLRRTECLYRPEESVEVTQVEVIELLPLGAFYVSRLPANPILVDPRVAGGHVPLGGTVCPQAFSWREIKEGIDRKEIAWRDIIDFYARHNCDEYAFFPSYRYRTHRSIPLPARPPEP